MVNFKMIFFVIFFFFLFSCQENNKIKKKYYDNGNLKEVSFFSKKEIDSIHSYYNSSNQPIKSVFIIKDSGQYHKVYYKNGELFKKGFINNNHKKVGNWYYYRLDGKLSDVREYLILNNKEVLNQIRFYNRDGNSINIGYDDFNIYQQKEFRNEEIEHKHSNYIAFTIPKDTIHKNEPFIAIAHYLTPNEEYSSINNSEIEIYIDGSEEKLNNDFSNERKIELNKFDNLAKDSMNQKAFPNAEKYYNYMSSFGTYPRTTGKKILRGYLIELVNDTLGKNSIKKKTINKIYFELPYFVKDTID